MSINEITGDRLKSKIGDQDAFHAGWELIFGKGKKNDSDIQKEQHSSSGAVSNNDSRTIDTEKK